MANLVSGRVSCEYDAEVFAHARVCAVLVSSGARSGTDSAIDPDSGYWSVTLDAAADRVLPILYIPLNAWSAGATTVVGALYYTGSGTNFYALKCTTAGVTGAVSPASADSMTLGDTVTDGTAVFTVVSLTKPVALEEQASEVV